MKLSNTIVHFESTRQSDTDHCSLYCPDRVAAVGPPPRLLSSVEPGSFSVGLGSSVGSGVVYADRERDTLL